jgi:endonuclease YncB( thermonuclease family)
MGGKDLIVNVKNHREDKYGRILGTVTMDGQSLADLLKINNYGVDYEGGKR